MQLQEILEIKQKISKHHLFQKSVSPFKSLQMEQFLIKGQPITQEQAQINKIDNIERKVIYRFDNNGLLHSDDLPAIEYYGHWEFWNHGFIREVVDIPKNVREFWIKGVPARIEKYKM